MKNLVWGLLVAGAIWIAAPYVIKNAAKTNNKVIGSAVSVQEGIEENIVYYRVHDGVCELVTARGEESTVNAEIRVTDFKIVKIPGAVKIFFE